MKNHPGQTVETYVKAPTPFILNHWESLLPDWETPPETIVLILLKSRFSLEGEEDLITQEKDLLLKKFLAGGQEFQLLSHQEGFLSEIISPKDGTPQYSNTGNYTFDLVATINSSLKFDFSVTQKGCKVLTHPQWGTHFYPGIFLSQATATSVQSLLSKILWR